MRFHEICRLDELSGVKAYKDKINTIRDLDEFMADMGFVSLSGGEFSRVYATSSNSTKRSEVVKVYNDACYDRFIAFCKANQNNPFLPKFRGNSIRLRPDARCINIERLRPASMDDIKNSGIIQLHRIVLAGDEDMWDLPQESRPLLDILKALDDNVGKECFIDLNDSNMMMRGNQLVIVDPYAPMHDTGWATTRK